MLPGGHRGTVILAIGTGAFVLARTGLLDGRRATTHWCHAADLARRYPRIRVDLHVVAVEDAGIHTAAGLSSVVEVRLEIVQRNRGAGIADEAARYAVVTGHPSGVRSQPVDRPPLEAGPEPLATVPAPIASPLPAG